MDDFAEMIHLILSNPGHGEMKGRVKESVRGLCEQFPLHMDRWQLGVF